MAQSTIDPTTSFTDRADYYVRSRPDYPAELLTFFQSGLSVSPASRIADIGAGTGILTKLLLKSGASVIAVEPNASMRSQAQAILGNQANFQSINGTAEATTLPDASVDLTTAGQAFHWFHRQKSRAEFARILAPGGWVALVWNERRDKDTPFGRQFDDLVHYYRPAKITEGFHFDDEGPIEEFFRPGGYSVARFDNHQLLDFDRLSGLVLSRSYIPLPGDERYEPMMRGLRELFDAHQAGGQVRMDYDTNAYYGRLHV